MRLPELSVRRPVFTTMLTLIVVILGIVSFDRLKTDLLPEIELPTLSIRTGFEGASPEIMERQVSQIIEEIVGTVPGVEEITSESSEGWSNVRVSFAWGTDINTAAVDMRAKLEDEINELPDDITGPRVNKFDIASFPIVIIGVSSNLDPVELTRIVNEQIRYRFARVPGVAQVDLWGGYDRQLRIELDPDRVNSIGISLDQILRALRNANLDLPAGQIEEGRFEVTLRAPAQFQSVEDIEKTVVAIRRGAAITIGDIANVRDTYEKITRIIRVNGERGIRVAIRKEADANTVEVAQGILGEIDDINRSFPQVEVVPMRNQGDFIERSIANVSRSVLYGGGLAIFVLLLFLRNIRSTFVIALSIPISVIATFALLYFNGFTLNLMTLGGLALGVGMMVDSSIVVLENIFRRRDELGENAHKAAVTGAQEVGAAIIASTITTLVIFLPLIFVRGVSGILFQELAYVIVFALACSLLVSLSVVPMLASKFLSHHESESLASRYYLFRKAAEWFKALDIAYASSLKIVLANRVKTILIVLGVLALSACLYPFIGTEFLPPSDEGEVRIYGDMEIGTRLDLVDQQLHKMEELVKPAVPELESVVASARGADAMLRMSLVPAKDRDRSNSEIARDLRNRLEGNIAGMEIRVHAPQGQFLLSRLIGGEGDIHVEIRGFEMETLDALAAEAAEVIQQVPGVTDVDANLDPGIPQQEIRIDRDKVANLGLSVRDITAVVQTAIAGSRAGQFRTEGISFDILVQLEDAQHRNIEDVLNLTLMTPSGEPVVLRNLVNTVEGRAPEEIERKDQQRLATVNINVDGRDKGTVAREIQQRLDSIARPTGYDLFVAGTYEEQKEAFNELLVSLLLALLLVYMVLACQYESFRDPFIVMFSVPLAAIGVLVTLFITHTTLNLQSSIGCIMLGGIVVNNAILLVDQAARLNAEGLGLNDSVMEAGRRRLRPILMTTLTTVLGLVPLALGIGEGADAQAPLARAVIGGLTGATFITLFLIPVIFTYFHNHGSRVSN